MMLTFRKSFVRRHWIAVTMLTTFIGVSALALNVLRQVGFGLPFTITKMAAVDERVSPAAAPGTPHGGRPTRLDPLLTPTPLDVPQSSPRPFDGVAFLEKLDRATVLSDDDRARLRRTLELAAQIQRGVDATADPRAQNDLELRLGAEVYRRLQLIVPREGLALAGDLGTTAAAFRFGPQH